MFEIFHDITAVAINISVLCAGLYVGVIIHNWFSGITMSWGVHVLYQINISNLILYGLIVNDVPYFFYVVWYMLIGFPVMYWLAQYKVHKMFQREDVKEGMEKIKDGEDFDKDIFAMRIRNEMQVDDKSSILVWPIMLGATVYSELAAWSTKTFKNINFAGTDWHTNAIKRKINQK